VSAIIHRKNPKKTVQQTVQFNSSTNSAVQQFNKQCSSTVQQTVQFNSSTNSTVQQFNKQCSSTKLKFSG
jgi:hypothetical protein